MSEFVGSFDSRGASARAVPYYLALYVRDPKHRTDHAKLLIASLANYVANLPALEAQIRRNGSHAGPNYLAPYYFFGTAPYFSEAIRLLKRDPAIDPDVKTTLGAFSNAFSSSLQQLYLEDGTFRPLDAEGLSSASDYANPLVGLALLSLADGCGGRDLDFPGVLGSGALFAE